MTAPDQPPQPDQRNNLPFVVVWFAISAFVLAIAIHAERIFSVSDEAARAITLLVGVGLMSIVILRELWLRAPQRQTPQIESSEDQKARAAREARLEDVEWKVAIGVISILVLGFPVLLFADAIFGMSREQADAIADDAKFVFFASLFAYAFLIRKRLLRPTKTGK